MDSKPTIWLLLDDKPGNCNQVLGVAEQLSKLGKYNIVKKQLYHNKRANLPNFLWLGFLFGVDVNKSDDLNHDLPDLVISAGRRNALPALYIKNKSGGHTKLVHIMHPGANRHNFDMVVMPKHDCKKGNKILNVTGSPNNIDAAELKAQIAEWDVQIKALPKPHIAVLIGGNTKNTKFTEQMAHRLVKHLNKCVGFVTGSLLITTSRRTPKKVCEIIKNSFNKDAYFYQWEAGKSNPYYAFMGAADSIVVTGDSMGMVSEACSTGKPVYIYNPRGLAPQKHRKLHKTVVDANMARYLDKDTNFESWSYTPLNDAKIVADMVKDLLN